MGRLTDLRLKIINFFKKNKKRTILVFLILWFIVIVINYILKNQQVKIPSPATTYKPHVTVLDNTVEVPEKYQKPIENLIDTYFNYCNEKKYEDAYNLISSECKEKNYPTLDQFKGYIDEVFEGKNKIYNIQSYSIIDNKYIYNVRILDDILATGTTEGYYYYEEKFVLTEENGNIKLSIAEYVGDEKMNLSVEDDYMIVEILNKSVDYESETYTVKVTNKTDNYIVISDNYQNNEIILNLSSETRQPANMAYANFFIKPNSTTTEEIVFNNYYDSGLKASKISFGAIRILKQYDWKVGTTQDNLDNAVRLYGLDINF